MTILNNIYYTTTFRMRAGQTGWIESGRGKFSTMHDDDVVSIIRHEDANKNLRSAEVTVVFPFDRERFETGQISDEEDNRARELARAMVLDKCPGTFFFKKPTDP